MLEPLLTSGFSSKTTSSELRCPRDGCDVSSCKERHMWRRWRDAYPDGGNLVTFVWRQSWCWTDCRAGGDSEKNKSSHTHMYLQPIQIQNTILKPLGENPFTFQHPSLHVHFSVICFGFLTEISDTFFSVLSTSDLISWFVGWNVSSFQKFILSSR